ncbi:MAG: DUF1801 domain-containing protein [Planctomycetota bacterium]|nr:DUF1801 domain-containing protein [Planctomycetota bacterium]
MAKRPTTIEQYLAALPGDRRVAIEAIRKVIKKNLDKRFEEGMQYGMPAYFLPHSEYPDGYHCDPRQPLPFAAVGSQKNHLGLYLFCIYCDEQDKDRFAAEWVKSGKKLDMGKSCVRVKGIEDVPLDVLGRAIKRATAKKFVAAYEAAIPPAAKKKIARQRAAREKAAAK